MAGFFGRVASHVGLSHGPRNLAHNNDSELHGAHRGAHDDRPHPAVTRKWTGLMSSSSPRRANTKELLNVECPSNGKSLLSRLCSAKPQSISWGRNGHRPTSYNGPASEEPSKETKFVNKSGRNRRRRNKNKQESTRPARTSSAGPLPMDVDRPVWSLALEEKLSGHPIPAMQIPLHVQRLPLPMRKESCQMLVDERCDQDARSAAKLALPRKQVSLVSVEMQSPVGFGRCSLPMSIDHVSRAPTRDDSMASVAFSLRCRSLVSMGCYQSPEASTYLLTNEPVRKTNTIDGPHNDMSPTDLLADGPANVVDVQEISETCASVPLDVERAHSTLDSVSVMQPDTAVPLLGKPSTIALPHVGSQPYITPTTIHEDALQGPQTLALAVKDSPARGMSLLELEIVNFGDVESDLASWNEASLLRASTTKSRLTRARGTVPYRRLGPRVRKHKNGTKKDSDVSYRDALASDGPDEPFFSNDSGSLLLRRSSTPLSALSGCSNGKHLEIAPLGRAGALVSKDGVARSYDEDYDDATDKSFRPRLIALPDIEPSFDSEDPGELADDEDDTEGQVNGLTSTMRLVVLNQDSA